MQQWSLANKALQQTGLSVASLPLAPAAEHQYVGRAKMSVELTVYMARAAMPSPCEWANAILDVGFHAELDAEFDVDSFSGFLPCRYEGGAAGFEYLSGPIEFVDELELPDHFDFSVAFVTHSNMRELASSTVAAAVLCSLSAGILVDPQADLAVSASEAISWARQQLEEIEL